MITSNIINSSSVKKVDAKVELYNGSTLVATCTCNNRLQNFTVERKGVENKFFGFGIYHKLSVNLLDINRTLTVSKGNTIRIHLGFDGEFVSPYPTFHVKEVSRDEKTNTISIAAYDALYDANAHTVSEIAAPYTISDFIASAPNLIEVSAVKFVGIGDNETCFETYYAGGANFEGTENYKDSLTAAAEVTQTIFYVDYNDKLVFKRLNIAGEPVLTISKQDYYELSSGENEVLAEIVHTTELGDNIAVSDEQISGTTQYIRNNPFWDTLDNVGTLLDNAWVAVGGMSNNQFICDWNGNYLLEVGDKVALVTEDNNTIVSYVLDDVITYDGTLSEITQWAYKQEESESATNSTSLGETLKQTYAKVDKANKQIELVASETNANSSQIAALRVDTNSIFTTVSETTKNTDLQIDNLEENYDSLLKEVNTKVTADQVNFLITKELSNGVESVTTSTGFTFNSDGLTIEKSDSEISTNIDEDGLSVYKNDEEVLTADNAGVKAKNLHATTYLIVGENTYFADYSENGEFRAGCFWTGK